MDCVDVLLEWMNRWHRSLALHSSTFVLDSDLFFFGQEISSSGFFTKLLLYASKEQQWKLKSLSGAVPVKIGDYFAIGNGWAMSPSKYNATVPLLKPAMAHFQTAKFETQIPDLGGRIVLLDNTNVLAFNNVIFLVNDAAPPSFLAHAKDEDVDVMQGKNLAVLFRCFLNGSRIALPIPLPSYLPRPE